MLVFIKNKKVEDIKKKLLTVAVCAVLPMGQRATVFDLPFENSSFLPQQAKLQVF